LVGGGEVWLAAPAPDVRIVAGESSLAYLESPKTFEGVK
jgi:hypothetical protein